MLKTIWLEVKVIDITLCRQVLFMYHSISDSSRMLALYHTIELTYLSKDSKDNGTSWAVTDFPIV